jgi:hypothetical protein
MARGLRMNGPARNRPILTPILTWQRLLLAALLTLGIAQVAYAFVAIAPTEHWLRSVCAAWDREAEAGALASYLDRARTHCRAGRLGLARQDYEALRTVSVDRR